MERHSLLATVLLVQLQLIGVSNSQSLDGSSSVACASPTPTVTANASVNSSLLQLPRPALPPPLRPDDPPLGPRPLLFGQCAVGAESAQASGLVEFADAERLYVDVGRPAECSGVVARWEVCFGDQAAPVKNVQIAVLRRQDSTMYRLSSVSELSLDPGDSEAAEAVCQYLEATMDVTVEQGDLIGFMSSNGIRIALSTHSNRSLHVYTQRLSQDGQLSSIGPVQQSQLQQLRQAVAPLIRIIINMTNISSTVAPSPTETTTPCPTDRTNGSNRTTRFYYILISSVIVAVVVIVILIVVVCVLVCCICKARCKLSKCCKLQKKEKKAQPQESIPDQSMQYNDLYVPRNPSHIIHNGRRFTARIHDNPAYGNPGSNAPRITSQVYNGPGNDDQQTAPHIQEDHIESSHSRTHRGLDHTYESIR